MGYIERILNDFGGKMPPPKAVLLKAIHVRALNGLRVIEWCSFIESSQTTRYWI